VPFVGGLRSDVRGGSDLSQLLLLGQFHHPRAQILGKNETFVAHRKLNACTVRDQYPLALIDDIFDQVAGSAIYSTLD